MWSSDAEVEAAIKQDGYVMLGASFRENSSVVLASALVSVIWPADKNFVVFYFC
jgi:hypothetical protein